MADPEEQVEAFEEQDGDLEDVVSVVSVSECEKVGVLVYWCLSVVSLGDGGECCISCGREERRVSCVGDVGASAGTLMSSGVGGGGVGVSVCACAFSECLRLFFLLFRFGGGTGAASGAGLSEGGMAVMDKSISAGAEPLGSTAEVGSAGSESFRSLAGVGLATEAETFCLTAVLATEAGTFDLTVVFAAWA